MPTEIIQLPTGQNGNQNGGLNVLPVLLRAGKEALILSTKTLEGLTP